MRFQKIPFLKYAPLLLSTMWCYSAGLSCPNGEWGCLDGKECISQAFICDGNHEDTYHCSDGSDEDPAICAQWNCTAAYWKCETDLRCIEEYHVCGGTETCSDGADEDPSIVFIGS